MRLDGERSGQAGDVAEQSAVVGDERFGLSLQFDFQVINVAVGAAVVERSVYRTSFYTGVVVDGDDAGANGLNFDAVEAVDIALNGLFCNCDCRCVVCQLNRSCLLVGQGLRGSVCGFLAGGDYEVRADADGAEVDERERQEDEENEKDHRRFSDCRAFVASDFHLALCHFLSPGKRVGCRCMHPTQTS